MLLRNVWAFIKKMSIKVISLILIAFLARNCYKYIINYKSVDFDNSYITPMFMRKVGVGKRFYFTRKLTDRILQDARRKRQGKAYVFPLRYEFLLCNSFNAILDSLKKLSIFPFGHRKWQQLKGEVLSCRQDRLWKFQCYIAAVTY